MTVHDLSERFKAPEVRRRLPKGVRRQPPTAEAVAAHQQRIDRRIADTARQMLDPIQVRAAVRGERASDRILISEDCVRVDIPEGRQSVLWKVCQY